MSTDGQVIRRRQRPLPIIFVPLFGPSRLRYDVSHSETRLLLLFSIVHLYRVSEYGSGPLSHKSRARKPTNFYFYKPEIILFIKNVCDLIEP